MPHSFTAFLQRCLSSQQRCGASRRRRTHGDAGLASATTHLELSTLCLSPHHLPPHHRPSFRRTTSSMAATRELAGVRPLLLPWQCPPLSPDDELDGGSTKHGESSPGPVVSSLAGGPPLPAGDEETDVEVGWQFGRSGRWHGRWQHATVAARIRSSRALDRWFPILLPPR